MTTEFGQGPASAETTREALIDRLEKLAKRAEECAANSEVVADLLQPQVELFDRRDAATPWNTYAVRMAVDHRRSVQRDTQEAADLRAAVAALSAPPVAAEAGVEFGNGNLGVDTGTVYGKPAVFIRPLDHTGPVGGLLPEEKQVKGPQQSLEPGEFYLTFPTMDHANRVADALVGTTQPADAEIARLRAMIAEKDAALKAAKKLERAANTVLCGLNARIDAAPSSAVPVFNGIADLHDALGSFRTARRAKGGE